MNANFLKAVSSYNSMANMVTSALKAPDVKASASATEPADSFSSLVTEALKATRETIAKSETMSARAITKKANLTDVVTAVSEAEIALQTAVNIRDKVIAAYQDIIKMPV